MGELERDVEGSEEIKRRVFWEELEEEEGRGERRE